MQHIWRPSVSIVLGVGSAIAAFVLYLMTLAPTLSSGWRGMGVDGAELLAAANTLGVPHPSGYPTYMLFLKAFGSIVAIGDFAYRGNLASAVLGALTVGLLYWLTLLIARKKYRDTPKSLLAIVSAFAALTFGAAPIFWSQSVITEVYTLNAVFVGGLAVLAAHIVLGTQGSKRRTAWDVHRLLATFGLILGVGLGNHLTLLAIAAPLAVWTWIETRPRLSSIAWGFVGLAVGLSIYAYLPIRAGAGPPVNWGDASSTEGFVWMLTGQAYQDYVFGIPLDSFIARLADWLDLVFTQFNPLGLFFVLVGIAAVAKTEKWLLLATLLSVAVLFGYAMSYNTFDAKVLTIPAFFLLSAYSGIGLLSVLTNLSRWASEGSRHRSRSRSSKNVLKGWRSAPITLAVAFVAVPFGSVAFNYSSQDLSDDWGVLEFAEAALDMAAPRSVIIGDGEAKTFALWYEAFVERPESEVIPISARLFQFDWYGPSLTDRHPGRLPTEWPDDVLGALEAIIDHSATDPGVYLTYFSPDLAEKYMLSLQPHGLYKVELR